MGRLPLIARGGRKPYQWLVNGEPLSSPSGQSRTEWRPNSVGQSILTVIDADGAAASAEIWLQ